MKMLREVSTVTAIVLLAGSMLAQEAAKRPAKATPTPAPEIAGTGTQNLVAKWTDGAGTLGDSSIFDNGTQIGIGTATPGAGTVVDIRRSSASDILMRMWNDGTAGSKLRYVAATGATSQLQLTDQAEWLSAIAGNNTIGLQFRVRAVGAPGGEATLDASPRMTIARNGRVGIGTTNPTALLHVAGDVVVDGNIAAKYQDVAEWVAVTSSVDAGMVVSLNPGRTNEVMASDRAYDTRVAGVVSEKPGLILGEASADKAMIATTGRVKVRVDATRRPIAIGDLLVTSDKPGVAMASEPVDVGGVQFHRPGTLIGKALEPLASGEGEILVLLSLQ
ncbi:MAG: hypothetical protein WC538_09375 [Thermoanaerobaculia bacterium]|jgi:hypothetical protein